jgi:hypothetical protein
VDWVCFGRAQGSPFRLEGERSLSIFNSHIISMALLRPKAPSGAGLRPKAPSGWPGPTASANANSVGVVWCYTNADANASATDVSAEAEKVTPTSTPRDIWKAKRLERLDRWKLRGGEAERLDRWKLRCANAANADRATDVNAANAGSNGATNVNGDSDDGAYTDGASDVNAAKRRRHCPNADGATNVSNVNAANASTNVTAANAYASALPGPVWQPGQDIGERTDMDVLFHISPADQQFVKGPGSVGPFLALSRRGAFPPCVRCQACIGKIPYMSR